MEKVLSLDADKQLVGHMVNNKKQIAFKTVVPPKSTNKQVDTKKVDTQYSILQFLKDQQLLIDKLFQDNPNSIFQRTALLDGLIQLPDVQLLNIKQSIDKQGNIHDALYTDKQLKQDSFTNNQGLITTGTIKGSYYLVPLSTINRVFFNQYINLSESKLIYNNKNKYFRSLDPGKCLLINQSILKQLND